MKVLIAGDYCDRYRVSAYIEKEQFGYLFDDIKDLLHQADYSIVNFEFPIKTAKAKKISKVGPALGGQKKSIDAIKFAGFCCCTLANNHILDQGEQCCLETKNELSKAGLDTVGAGENIEDASIILYKKIKNETLAIINCCEHEFSIATDTTAGAYPLNTIQQYYKIQEACKNADYVLVIVHGGHEMYSLPSPRMKELYRFFIDAGADAVVNHHQHVYSGYEVYRGKPIFYGLGNFLFDGPRIVSDWNKGYMVSIETNTNTFDIIPYLQCTDEASVKLLNDNEKNEFQKDIQILNEIIGDDNLLKEKFISYSKQFEKDMKVKLSPYDNLYVQEASIRGFLPSFVSKKKVLDILNYVECEAHRDLFIESLKQS